MNNKIKYRRIITIATIDSLILLYVLIFLQTIIIKSKRDGSDFMGLYSAAWISKKYGFSEIYDVDKQIRIQSDIVGYQFPKDQTSYFTHPPFVVLLVNLVANDDYINSLVRWSLFLVLLNGINTYILVKGLADYKFSKGETWILAFGIFLFWPTFSGFINGQDALILLLGTSIWGVQLFAGNQITSGVGLSLSAIRPQMAIFLSMPFLLKKQNIFLGFVIGAGILALASLALIGLSGLHKYITILGVVESEMWRLPHSKDMPAIAGIIRRNFGGVDKDFFRDMIWGSFIAGLMVVLFWWKKDRGNNEKQIGLLIMAALIFTPYAHYHELALLLIPVLCLIRVFLQNNLVSKGILCLFPLSISIVLLIGFVGGGSLKYILVYFVMSLLGYFLIFPEKIEIVRIFIENKMNQP